MFRKMAATRSGTWGVSENASNVGAQSRCRCDMGHGGCADSKANRSHRQDTPRRHLVIALGPPQPRKSCDSWPSGSLPESGDLDHAGLSRRTFKTSHALPTTRPAGLAEQTCLSPEPGRESSFGLTEPCWQRPPRLAASHASAGRGKRRDCKHQHYLAL